MRRNGPSVARVEALELELHDAVVKLAHKVLELGRLELLLSVVTKEDGEQSSRINLMRISGSGRALDERRGSPEGREGPNRCTGSGAHLSTFMTRLNSC